MKQSSINLIKIFIVNLIVISHLILLIQNWSFIKEGYMIGMSSIDLYQTLWDLKYTFTILTGSIFAMVCILLAFNISMVWLYFKERGELILKYDKSKSLLGTVLAVLGLSCASCGAVAITFILSLFGGVALPLQGAEIGIVGVLLLGYSSYTLWKKYRAPKVC